MPEHDNGPTSLPPESSDRPLIRPRTQQEILDQWGINQPVPLLDNTRPPQSGTSPDTPQSTRLDRASLFASPDVTPATPPPAPVTPPLSASERAAEQRRIAEAARAAAAGAPPPPSDGGSGRREGGGFWNRLLGRGGNNENRGNGQGGNGGEGPPAPPENPLNPEDRDRIEAYTGPQLLDRIAEIYKLSYVERDTHNAELELLFERFKNVAVNERVLDQKPEVTIEREKARRIAQEFDLSDTTQKALRDVAFKKVKKLFWDEEIQKARQQLASETDQAVIDYLTERINSLQDNKVQLDQEIANLKDQQKDANGNLPPGTAEYENASIAAENEVWKANKKTQRDIEKAIQHSIEKKKSAIQPPAERIAPRVDNINLPRDEAIRSVNDLETVIANLPKASDLVEIANGTNNPNILISQDTALQLIEWYAHQARRFGMFADIEDTISSRYLEIRANLQSKGSSVSELSKLPQEARDFAAAMEDDFYWEPLVDTGIATVNLADKFKGLRGRFVSKGYKQIATRIQQIKRGDIRPINFNPGDWDVNYEDYKITMESAINSEYTRNYDDNSYQVTLETRSQAAFLKGIDQYLDHIINGSGKFDANEIFQSMNKLGNAIEMLGKQFFTQDQLNELRRSAEVRLYMHTAQYFAMIGQTEIYAQIMDRMADKEGLKRIALIPQLNNGLTGLAIYLLEHDKQFELLFRPAGHRGQMAESVDAQKYMREKMREKLAMEVLKWEIRDYYDGEDRLLLTDEEREVRREFFKKQLTKNINAPDYIQRNFMPNTRYETVARATDEHKDEAKDVAATAVRYFDVFGQTSKLSAPGWAPNRKFTDKMPDPNNPNRQIDAYRVGQGGEKIPTRFIEDMGDSIRVDDVIFFLKYAVLQSQVGTNRTVANIRKDGAKTPQNHDQAHHYYDGLNHDEKHAFDEAIHELQRNGFKATWNGKTFEEIIKLPEVQQIQNNFTGIDDDSRTRIASQIVHASDNPDAEWFKYVKNVLDPRGVLFNSKIRQTELDEYVQAVENSRNFHSTIQRMLYREINSDRDKLDYGLGNMPLVIKRAQYLPLYYMANVRERISRAVTLIPELPTYFSSFADEIGARNMLEVVSLIDRGAYDEYEIQRHLMRIQEIYNIKKLCEGDIGKDGQRLWGLFEKPVSTATRLWNIFYHEAGPHSVPTKANNEKIVGASMELFKTFGQIANFVEKLLNQDKGAGGSGAGREEIAKFWAAYQFRWLYEHRKDANKRTQGGLEAYKDAEEGWHELEHHPFDPQKPEGVTILQEVFRRLEPSHDPVLSDNSTKSAA